MTSAPFSWVFLYMLTDFKNKKVLVFGLGLLGGGVATTNWLIKQGALVTVSDPKTEKELASSVKKIKTFQGRTLKFELGRQTKKQIQENEIIVVNPGVPISHPLIQYARKVGKIIGNEATLFFKYFSKPVIAVTGTRGKTTTTAWINHFLNGKIRSAIVGNSTESPFLKVISRQDKLDIAVAEVPSFHLELFNANKIAPQIVLVTNLFVDHINWHGTFEAYALAKAAIFASQQAGQVVILNADNAGTKFFLRQKPAGHVWFFSLRPLKKNQNGVFYRHQSVYYQFEGRAHTVLKLGNFVREYGEHNLQNLLASALAAFLAGVSGEDIQKRIPTLPGIPFRQETVFKNDRLRIINDTTATSPEGGMAALKRFGGKNTILITGGTDRDLDFKDWAKELPKHIQMKNVVFLAGSATIKMTGLLRPYFAKATKGGEIYVFESLKECLDEALKKSRNLAKSVIVFSPASKSFEKFKNEYDRGEQFNRLVKKLVVKKMESRK